MTAAAAAEAAEMTASAATPLLQMVGVSKRFAGVRALTQVSLEVGQGEVVALIGENGAGKSTLMKILGGVHQPDEGEIRVGGRSITIRSVTDAVNKLQLAYRYFSV